VVLLQQLFRVCQHVTQRVNSVLYQFLRIVFAENRMKQIVISIIRHHMSLAIVFILIARFVVNLLLQIFTFEDNGMLGTGSSR
jgi:hypothetical protein